MGGGLGATSLAIKFSFEERDTYEEVFDSDHNGFLYPYINQL